MRNVNGHLNAMRSSLLACGDDTGTNEGMGGRYRHHGCQPYRVVKLYQNLVLYP